MNPDDLPYRPCVGVMLFNRAGDVFTGRRIDQDGGEAWQMPQGGVDEGEESDLPAAAFRELHEETGIAKNKVKIVAEHHDWLTYDLPPDLLGKALKGRYRGQTQKWFLARFLGKDKDVRLDLHEPEFNAWQWTPYRDLPKVIVPFKRALYEVLVEGFGPIIEKSIKD